MIRPTVRHAEPEDIPQIKALHAQIEEQMGFKMDLPEFFIKDEQGKWKQNPVIGSVFVVEVDGKIVHGCYQEKCVENVHFGHSAVGVAALREQVEEYLFMELSKIGIRFVHTLVPCEFDSLVGKHLEASGFTRSNFIHYSRQVGQ